MKEVEMMKPLDPDEDKIVEDVLSKIKLPEYKETVLDDASAIRDKLQTLKEGDRLDASAIKNLPQGIREVIQHVGLPETQIKAGTNISVRKDASGSWVITSTVTGGVAENITGLIAEGTGIDITGSGTSGDPYVITATGGGGVTVETPIGAVDGSNKTYTVSTEPAWVVADGVTYFDGAGYTYSALTITMDSQPVSFIRSIY